jgi:hypothetical protein
VRAARGEAAALGAVTPRAVTLMAVMAMVMVMVTVAAAAAVKGGLLRRPRRGAVTTAIGTGAAAVGMAAITMVGKFLDQSWLP